MLKHQSDLLNSAILIAVEAHFKQRDKAGKPYILHPLHLMSQFPNDPVVATVAVLHDVVEDTSVTIEKLRLLGFDCYGILEALELLTHKDGVPYEDYIVGIAEDSLATQVKLEDLKHNSSIERLVGVREKDIKRMAKYHKAYLYLTGNITVYDTLH